MTQIASYKVFFNPVSSPFSHVDRMSYHGTDLQCIEYLLSESSMNNLVFVEQETAPFEVVKYPGTLVEYTKGALDWINKTAIDIGQVRISLKQNLINAIGHDLFDQRPGADKIIRIRFGVQQRRPDGHADIQDCLVVTTLRDHSEISTVLGWRVYAAKDYHIEKLMTIQREFAMDSILSAALKGAYSTLNTVLENCLQDGKPATPKMKVIQQARAMLPSAFSMSHTFRQTKEN